MSFNDRVLYSNINIIGRICILLTLLAAVAGSCILVHAAMPLLEGGIFGILFIAVILDGMALVVLCILWGISVFLPAGIIWAITGRDFTDTYNGIAKCPGPIIYFLGFFIYGDWDRLFWLKKNHKDE